MKKTYFLLVFVLVSLTSFSQDISFTKANFPGREKELRVAKKQMKKGLKLISNSHGDQREALNYLLAADAFNPDNARLNFEIGYLLLRTHDSKSALPYLEKACALDPEVDPEIHYLLGRAYHLNHHFILAREHYAEFSRTLSPKELKKRGDELSQLMKEAATGDSLSKTPVRCFVDNMGERINSPYPDYAPVLGPDGMKLFFTSRRPGSTGGDPDADNLPFEDIYYLKKTGSTWSDPINAGEGINTDKHEALCTISPDNAHLYLRRGDPDGDFYMVPLAEQKKSRAVKLSKRINSAADENSASITPDGNTLWFVSDRKGGLGGKDIWVSTLDEKGHWTKAVNAGPQINTPKDEESPFFHAGTKTLYFSSKGHQGMGGYDIFSVSMNEDGSFNDPVNMGFPVNSASDDLHFSLDDKGRVGLLASSRPGGYGHYDLYKLTLLEEEKPVLFYLGHDENDLMPLSLDEITPAPEREVGEPVVLLQGYIRDAAMDEPVAALVSVYDIRSGDLVAAYESDRNTGFYILQVPCSGHLGMYVQSAGHILYVDRQDLSKVSPYSVSVKDIRLDSIVDNSSFAMTSLSFPVDASELDDISGKLLGPLVDFLEINPMVKVQVQGYTMLRESAENLGRKRAAAVSDYLAANGISRERIIMAEDAGVGSQETGEELPAGPVRIIILSH